MRELADYAIARFERDVGDMGCIGDASCDCFACDIRSKALDLGRKQCGIESDFANEMLVVRELLNPIVEGVIERGHCVGRAEAYGGRRGYRKTMLKDAVSIAKTAIAKINKAVNLFQCES